ncbi:hypothetical protein E2F47_23595 [Mycobacterium eburneum]|nr:hypothetical protein E2F47_23595 [Mycobacterium eburneum]
MRAAWAPVVATGRVQCARCGQQIEHTDAWDLGHTSDRSGYNGPEHEDCNRSAARRVQSNV